MVRVGNQMDIGWTKLRPSFSKSHRWASLGLRYPKPVDWESLVRDSSVGVVVLWGGFMGVPSRAGVNEPEPGN